MTLDELLTGLGAVRDANHDAGARAVEADLGPVDAPVLRVGSWHGPESESPGRVVLDRDR